MRGKEVGGGGCIRMVVGLHEEDGENDLPTCGGCAGDCVAWNEQLLVAGRWGGGGGLQTACVG